MSGTSSILTRRGFLGRGLALAGLGLLAGCSRGPQLPQPPPGVPVIGYLTESGPAAPPELDIFQRALEEYGYKLGRDLVVDARTAASQPDKLGSLAGQLASR